MSIALYLSVLALKLNSEVLSKICLATSVHIKLLKLKINLMQGWQTRFSYTCNTTSEMAFWKHFCRSLLLHVRVSIDLSPYLIETKNVYVILLLWNCQETVVNWLNKPWICDPNHLPSIGSQLGRSREGDKFWLDSRLQFYSQRYQDKYVSKELDESCQSWLVENNITISKEKHQNPNFVFWHLNFANLFLPRFHACLATMLAEKDWDW